MHHTLGLNQFPSHRGKFTAWGERVTLPRPKEDRALVRSLSTLRGFTSGKGTRARAGSKFKNRKRQSICVFVLILSGLFSFIASGEQSCWEQRFLPPELIKVPARQFAGRGGSSPAAAQRTAAETVGIADGRRALCSFHSFALVSAVPTEMCGIGRDLSPLFHSRAYLVPSLPASKREEPQMAANLRIQELSWQGPGIGTLNLGKRMSDKGWSKEWNSFSTLLS